MNDVGPISWPIRSLLAFSRDDLPGPDAILGGMRADIAENLGLALASGQGRSLRDFKAASPTHVDLRESFRLQAAFGACPEGSLEPL